MDSVPLRELVLVLAAADQLTDPLPLPLVGVQVSQLVALLVGVQLQPAVAVTVKVPLPPVAATEVLVGDNA